jgi:xylulokinase
MPALVEGSQPAGRMRPELAHELGFNAPPLFAGGAGDNAAGAVGLGAVTPGSSFLSLGTSGVLWRTTAGFEPRAGSAVHSFCHALPDRWHQMSVHLSAAACLSWWASVSGQSEAALLGELSLEAGHPSPVLFTPYLSGERTPHNDPQIRGVFAGLGHETDRSAMTQAVLEGVAFAFRDGKEALETGSSTIREAMVIGGGARSDKWLSILADTLNLPLKRYDQAGAGAAFGAARLAQIACTGESPETVCTPPSGEADVFAPHPARAAIYAERYAVWRRAAEVSRTLR